MELTHGGDVLSYSMKYGRVPLDFSCNLNPLGIPQGVKIAAQNAIEAANAYPDPLCRKLCEKIATRDGVSAKHVLCGNGAADLIYRIVLGIKPTHSLLPIPSFSEYEQALQLCGGDIEYFQLKEENEYQLTDEILAHISSKTKLVFLCNPNNPTGQCIEPKLLLDILECCAKNDTTLVVDECFTDFLAQPNCNTVVGLIKQYPNLVVLKAFTKTYAMAGLRLGYLLCSNIDLIETISKAGQPWAVSNIAQAAGLAALDEVDFLEKTRLYIQQENEFLRTNMQNLRLTVIGSNANFIFFKSEHHDLDKEMADMGVLIRSCANYRGINGNWYRVAVRTHDENVALLSAFEKI